MITISPLRAASLLAGAGLGVAVLVTAVPAAEVYRSVDAAGNVVYSDRPDAPGATAIEIRVAAPAPPPPPVPRPRVSRGNTADGAVDPAVAAAAQAEQTRNNRAEMCEQARERNERYQRSRRLYRESEAGERVYLSDPELDTARSEAAAAVTEWCG